MKSHSVIYIKHGNILLDMLVFKFAICCHANVLKISVKYDHINYSCSKKH